MSTELLESLRFDLSYAFSCDSELTPYFFECMHIATIETETHHDDLLLPWRQEVEHVVEIFFQYCEIRRFLRSEIFIILDEVTERRIFFTSHR